MSEIGHSPFRLARFDQKHTQSKTMDTLLVSFLSAVLAACGHGLWWALKRVRLVRSELSDGGAEVLGAAVALGLAVMTLFVFW